MFVVTLPERCAAPPACGFQRLPLSLSSVGRGSASSSLTWHYYATLFIVQSSSASLVITASDKGSLVSPANILHSFNNETPNGICVELWAAAGEPLSSAEASQVQMYIPCPLASVCAAHRMLVLPFDSWERNSTCGVWGRRCPPTRQ